MKVLGIGNAIVDVICKVEENFIKDNNLTKGTMKLIFDKKEFNNILAKLKIEKTVSGGSVANSMVGLSQLKNDVGFIGKISDDNFGKKYEEGLKEENVKYFYKKQKESLPTGTCLILVTPDSERTMCTFLGIAGKINENDIYGFSFQYGQSDTDVGSNGSGIDGKNYSIAWYRTKPIDNNNFIEGTIGIGKLKTDIERNSGSNTLTASRNGEQIFGSINFGKNISKGNFDFNPILRVDFGYTMLNEYSEEGTDALSYGDQEIQNGLLSLGFGFNNLIKFEDSKLKPIGLVELGLDFSDSSTTKLNYVSDTSTVYTYTHDNASDYMLTSEIGFLY